MLYTIAGIAVIQTLNSFLRNKPSKVTRDERSTSVLPMAATEPFADWVISADTLNKYTEMASQRRMPTTVTIAATAAATATAATAAAAATTTTTSAAIAIATRL